MQLYKIRGVTDFPDGKYGVEIEVESADSCFELHTFNGWFQTEDPSLRNSYNTELVLNRPLGYPEVTEKLAELQGELERRSISHSPSVRTGVHVHLNVNNRTAKELTNIIALYFTLERVLTHYCGPEREGNLFCLRTCDCPALVEAVMRSAQSGFWLNYAAEAFKYASLNLSTLSKFGSIEFRSLKTPENLSDISEWISILEALETYAVGLTNLKEIPYSISYYSLDVWLRKVFGNKLFDKLYYPEMEADIKKDMRNIQPLYHTNVVDFKSTVRHTTLTTLDEFIPTDEEVEVLFYEDTSNLS